MFLTEDNIFTILQKFVSIFNILKFIENWCEKVEYRFHAVNRKKPFVNKVINKKNRPFSSPFEFFC